MSIATVRHGARATVVAILSGMLLVVAMAGTAFAQYPPAASLSVSCAPGAPTPGASVTCTITGAPGNTTLTIVVTFNPELFNDTVTTNADGEASFSFDVPEDAQAGDTITITVEGEEIEGSLDDELTVATAVADDAAAEDDEPLPRTGFEAGQLLLIGLLIVAVGIGGVVAARRREDTREKI